MKRALLLVMVASAAACGDDPDPLRVELDSGPVQGVAIDGVHRFLGVPYAAPPTGANRWRAPQPVEPWTEVYEARTLGVNCAQTASLFGESGDEDCLFLNVWAPETAPADPLPVLVWIHGGGFFSGSGGESYYDGAVLVTEQDVVVVTINYRLGGLGFLAHPALSGESTDDVSGNYGLLDQRAAFAWVQRNIAAFGGDPERVAIVGESAGGASVCIQYLSPDTADLFHVAVSESGVCSANVGTSLLADAEVTGVAVAERLGCDGTGAAAADCLRAVAAEEVVAALALAAPADQPPGGFFYFDAGLTLPVVDGVVFPEAMETAFLGGDYAKRPLLLGTNSDEGQLLHSDLLANDIDDEEQYRAALAVRFGVDNVDAIVAHYDPADFESPNRALSEVTTDGLFVCPARRTARAVADNGVDVFLYSFEFEPVGSIIDDGGAFHGAEIPFVFGIDESPLGRIGDAGAPLSEAMRGYWSQFAGTGNPNSEGTLGWPSYDEAGDVHMVLDVPLATGTELKAGLCDFWDAIVVP